jgi:hypothetical protein
MIVKFLFLWGHRKIATIQNICINILFIFAFKMLFHDTNTSHNTDNPRN